MNKGALWRRIQEPANVRVQNPVHPLPLDTHIQRIQRRMRAASGPEPVRKAPEVHLLNLIEDGHHGLLDDLVFQRRDAQRALASVGFR